MLSVRSEREPLKNNILCEQSLYILAANTVFLDTELIKNLVAGAANK
jgi:hypothetical protein